MSSSYFFFSFQVSADCLQGQSLKFDHLPVFLQLELVHFVKMKLYQTHYLYYLQHKQMSIDVVFVFLGLVSSESDVVVTAKITVF